MILPVISKEKIVSQFTLAKSWFGGRFNGTWIFSQKKTLGLRGFLFSDCCIRLMEEIPNNHLRCIKPVVNNGGFSISTGFLAGFLQVQGLMQWEFSAIIEASSCHHQSETKIGWDRNVDLKMMVYLEVGSR